MFAQKSYQIWRVSQFVLNSRLSLCLFLLVGHAMSPRQSDQLSERSQLSTTAWQWSEGAKIKRWLTHWLTMSPIQPYWTAKNLWYHIVGRVELESFTVATKVVILAGDTLVPENINSKAEPHCFQSYLMGRRNSGSNILKTWRLRLSWRTWRQLEGTWPDFSA